MGRSGLKVATVPSGWDTLRELGRADLEVDHPKWSWEVQVGTVTTVKLG